MGDNLPERGATDMAIAHDVLGRLARFNTARRDKSDEEWRVSEGQRDSRQQRASRLTRALLLGIRVLRWLIGLTVLALIGWGVHYA
jgi:hypothetical protein